MPPDNTSQMAPQSQADVVQALISIAQAIVNVNAVPWSAWVPTFTNLSGGALTFARYVKVGGTVFFRLKYTLGGPGVAGNVSFTLPIAGNATFAPAPIGDALFDDTGTNSFYGKIHLKSAVEAYIYVTNVAGTYPVIAGLSPTVPHAWANTDVISIWGSYEAAAV